jgi:hypothetical protein
MGGETDGTSTIPRVLVCGDTALDHILVRRKNAVSASEKAHLFLDWPDEASFVHREIDGGTPTLFKILEQMPPIGGADEMEVREVLEEGMDSSGSKRRKVRWETFSEWAIERLSDPEDREDKVTYNECEQSEGDIGARVILRKQYGRHEIGTDAKVGELVIDKQEGSENPYNVVSIYDNAIEDKEGFLEQVKDKYFPSDDPSSRPLLLIRTRLRRGAQLPPFICGMKQQRESTVLLLNIDEMQWAGFFIEKPVSWEQVLRETAQCIREIEEHEKFLAIVVCFKNQGAVIYCKDYYSLVFFEDAIGDLSSDSGDNQIYGSMMVSQAALTVALVRLVEVLREGGEERGETEWPKEKLRKVVETLNKGLEAGLYAKRRLLRTGYDARLEKREDRRGRGEDQESPLVDVKELKFPAKRVAHDIATAFNSGEPKKEKGKDRAPSVVIIEDSDLGIEDPGAPGSSRAKLYYKPVSDRPFISILKHVVWRIRENPDLSVRRPTEVQHYEPRDFFFPQWRVEKTEFTTEFYDSIFYHCKQIVEQGRMSRTEIEDGLGGTVACRIPYLRMKNLLTYDSNQIAQICDTYNVLKLYRRLPDNDQPLSVCVFGSAGSGKGFIVKQMMAHLNERTPEGYNDFEDISFNLSQMNKAEDLAEAFHQVRDLGLKKKLPLVFFDEFDSAFDGVPFGWLRFFLAPMQDGEFFQEGKIHTIGRAVFVFVGSVAHTMKDFQEMAKTGIGSDGGALKSMKGSDFVSRTRGYIEVAGPNETNHGILHFFRRASVLRSTLERKLNLGKEDYIGIDEKVLRAFLNARSFSHGARSMVAIVEMSDFQLNKRITPSCIYKSGRLHLHVSPDFQEALRLDRSEDDTDS